MYTLSSGREMWNICVTLSFFCVAVLNAYPMDTQVTPLVLNDALSSL